MKTIAMIVIWLCIGSVKIFADDSIQIQSMQTSPDRANRLLPNVHDLLDRHDSSYHILLRALSQAIEPVFVGRPFSVVAEDLKKQGFRLVRSWENGAAINSHYLMATNYFVAPTGYSMDLYLILHAESLNYASPSYRTGLVFNADASLVMTVAMPFSNLVEQARFPKGTVVDRVLTMPDVKDAGSQWPLVKNICVSYGYLNDRWAKFSPFGFTVKIEFVTDPDDVGIKTLTYTLASGLDPRKSVNGGSVDENIFPNDSLGEAIQIGASESWRGDDESIERAKGKYLKGIRGLNRTP